MLTCVCWVNVTVIIDLLVRSELGNRRFRLVFTVDPMTGDSKTETRTIRGFISVRAVYTRRLFGSKIASFLVSVCSYVISYLLLSVRVYMLLVIFHVKD